MIHCFMSCTCDTLDFVSILSFSVSNSTWGFDKPGIVPFVPIIALNSLAIEKIVLKCMPEKCLYQASPHMEMDHGSR
jgi:hypothetical protein